MLERLGRGLCTLNFHAVPVVCPLAALQPPGVAEENPLGMGEYPPGEPGHSGLTSGKPRGDGEVLLGSLSPTLGHQDHQQPAVGHTASSVQEPWPCGKANIYIHSFSSPSHLLKKKKRDQYNHCSFIF